MELLEMNHDTARSVRPRGRRGAPTRSATVAGRKALAERVTDGVGPESDTRDAFSQWPAASLWPDCASNVCPGPMDGFLIYKYAQIVGRGDSAVAAISD